MNINGASSSNGSGSSSSPSFSLSRMLIRGVVGVSTLMATVASSVAESSTSMATPTTTNLTNTTSSSDPGLHGALVPYTFAFLGVSLAAGLGICYAAKRKHFACKDKTIPYEQMQYELVEIPGEYKDDPTEIDRKKPPRKVMIYANRRSFVAGTNLSGYLYKDYLRGECLQGQREDIPEEEIELAEIGVDNPNFRSSSLSLSKPGSKETVEAEERTSLSLARAKEVTEKVEALINVNAPADPPADDNLSDTDSSASIASLSDIEEPAEAVEDAILVAIEQVDEAQVQAPTPPAVEVIVEIEAVPPTVEREAEPEEAALQAVTVQSDHECQSSGTPSSRSSSAQSISFTPPSPVMTSSGTSMTPASSLINLPAAVELEQPAPSCEPASTTTISTTSTSTSTSTEAELVMILPASPQAAPSIDTPSNDEVLAASEQIIEESKKLIGSHEPYDPSNHDPFHRTNPFFNDIFNLDTNSENTSGAQKRGIDEVDIGAESVASPVPPAPEEDDLLTEADWHDLTDEEFIAFQHYLLEKAKQERSDRTSEMGAVCLHDWSSSVNQPVQCGEYVACRLAEMYSLGDPNFANDPEYPRMFPYAFTDLSVCAGNGIDMPYNAFLDSKSAYDFLQSQSPDSKFVVTTRAFGGHHYAVYHNGFSWISEDQINGVQNPLNPDSKFIKPEEPSSTWLQVRNSRDALGIIASLKIQKSLGSEKASEWDSALTAWMLKHDALSNS